MREREYEERDGGEERRGSMENEGARWRKGREDGGVGGVRREKEKGRGILESHTFNCVWVWSKVYWFPSLCFLFPLSLLSPSPSLLLPYFSLYLLIFLPTISALQYRAGMDNPVIALRFGLLLEMYCRGSPNHMIELQQQVQCNSVMSL